MLLGHKLLTSLLKNNDVTDYYHAKLDPNYFVSEELAIYQFIESHLKAHGALPAISTVKESFGDLPEVPEPPSYYLAKVEERFGFNTYNNALPVCVDLLKNKDIQGLMKTLETAAVKIKNSNTRTSILDFGKDGAMLFKQTHAATFMGDIGISFGWPTMDRMTGGMVGGDIVSVVGRPASGKTYFNLWIAYWAYIHQQRSVLFISMEMGLPLVTQRFIGVITKSSMDDIQKGQLSSVKLNSIVSEISALNDLKHRMWIVDGSLKTTVGDVSAYINQFKPALVVIDGAYLMKHENTRLDRNTRVAENIELLKQISEMYHVPMLLSYQFNREASKKKSKGEEAGVEDIAFSDSIGQISSLVLGLNQPESSETLKGRVIKVLKGRGGESGQFNINWNFEAVDFSEVVEHEYHNHNDAYSGGYATEDDFVD